MIEGKAHIHDIQNHPDLKPEVCHVIDQIMGNGWASVDDLDVIREEWERLGMPLCICGCNER